MRIQYKPGWEISTGRSHLTIHVPMTDSRREDGLVGVHASWPLPKTGLTAEFVRECLSELETHELDEWLRIDGDLIFDPHNKTRAISYNPNIGAGVQVNSASPQYPEPGGIYTLQTGSLEGYNDLAVYVQRDDGDETEYPVEFNVNSELNQIEATLPGNLEENQNYNIILKYDNGTTLFLFNFWAGPSPVIESFTPNYGSLTQINSDAMVVSVTGTGLKLLDAGQLVLTPHGVAIDDVEYGMVVGSTEDDPFTNTQRELSIENLDPDIPPLPGYYDLYRSYDPDTSIISFVLVQSNVFRVVNSRGQDKGDIWNWEKTPTDLGYTSEFSGPVGDIWDWRKSESEMGIGEGTEPVGKSWNWSTIIDGGNTPQVTITSVDPDTLSVADLPATVTLTGTGFNTASEGSLALSLSDPEVSLTDFTVSSDTEITAAVPTDTPSGSYLVTVYYNDSADWVTSADPLLTITAPLSITSVTPTTITPGQEVQIQFDGNLDNLGEFTLGTQDGNGVRVLWNNQVPDNYPAVGIFPTYVEWIVPDDIVEQPGAGEYVFLFYDLGTHQVVTDSHVTTIEAPNTDPVLDSVTPNPAEPDSNVTITGSNLDSATRVAFSGNGSDQPLDGGGWNLVIVSNSDTEIVATLYAGTGDQYLQVQTSNGRSNSIPISVVHSEGGGGGEDPLAPALDSVTPNPAYQGSQVTLTGSRLADVDRVAVSAGGGLDPLNGGSWNMSIISQSDTEIVFTLNPSATGSQYVQVHSLAGGSNNLPITVLWVASAVDLHYSFEDDELPLGWLSTGTVDLTTNPGAATVHPSSSLSTPVSNMQPGYRFFYFKVTPGYEQFKVHIRRASDDVDMVSIQIDEADKTATWLLDSSLLGNFPEETPNPTWFQIDEASGYMFLRTNDSPLYLVGSHSYSPYPWDDFAACRLVIEATSHDVVVEQIGS